MAPNSPLISDLSRVSHSFNPAIYLSLSTSPLPTLLLSHPHTSLHNHTLPLPFHRAFSLHNAAVSNAGGYHSTKDYFKNERNDPSIAKISVVSEQAVKITELHDFQQSQENAKDIQGDLKGGNADKLRSFLPSKDQEESWVRTASYHLSLVLYI